MPGQKNLIIPDITELEERLRQADCIYDDIAIEVNSGLHDKIIGRRKDYQRPMSDRLSDLRNYLIETAVNNKLRSKKIVRNRFAEDCFFSVMRGTAIRRILALNGFNPRIRFTACEMDCPIGDGITVTAEMLRWLLTHSTFRTHNPEWSTIHKFPDHKFAAGDIQKVKVLISRS